MRCHYCGESINMNKEESIREEAGFYYCNQSCQRLFSKLPVESALTNQISGKHYKNKGIQPVEYIFANKLDFFEGNAIKYITRWREKGGLSDLEKAKHYIDLLIELEGLKDEEQSKQVSGQLDEGKGLETIYGNESEYPTCFKDIRVGTTNK